MLDIPLLTRSSLCPAPHDVSVDRCKQVIGGYRWSMFGVIGERVYCGIEMNTIRAIVCMGVRGYSRRVRRFRPDASGIRRKLGMAREIGPEQVKLDLEDVDPEDIAAFESDFSKAHEYYDMHQSEVAQSKQKLGQDITARKYFKTVEPSFITLVEREEIKKLHREDPEEWTVETLSKSFPILPDGIRKILKDKWRPKSLERALAYDKKIAENWKGFHAGRVSVGPALRQHLTKFGHRQIDLKDRDALVERFVARKMQFPEPKTKVFSTILDYIEDSRSTESHVPLQTGETPVTETTSTAVAVRAESNAAPEEIKKKKNKNTRTKDKKLTFTEFVEEKYDEINEQCKQEAEVLLDTYQKHVQSTSEKVATTEATESATKSNAVTEQRRYETNELTTTSLNDRPAHAAIEDKENYSLSTYVAKWEKLHDIEPTYYYPIKIPKGAYRKGKLYRIGDCYYADDGEFLYRVPGLRS